MMVVLGSVRGSPGVTSWSLLLATAWPVESAIERIVLEADEAGGVVGARYGWGVDPGLASLAAALRRNQHNVELSEHGREVAPGLFVVPAPETAERTAAVLRACSDELAERLANDGRVWFVDVGRLDDRAQTTGFVERAAATLLVSSGRPEDVVPLRSRAEAIRARQVAFLGLIVAGPCQYGRGELLEFGGFDYVWAPGTTDDLRNLAAGVLSDSRRSRRSLVWRHALELAVDLSARLAGQDQLDDDRTEVRAGHDR
jgi:hypothetical protein